MELKIGPGIGIDDLSEEIDGKGQRSKVKVTRLKSVIF